MSRPKLATFFMLGEGDNGILKVCGGHRWTCFFGAVNWCCLQTASLFLFHFCSLTLSLCLLFLLPQAKLVPFIFSSIFCVRNMGTWYNFTVILILSPSCLYYNQFGLSWTLLEWLLATIALPRWTIWKKKKKKKNHKPRTLSQGDCNTIQVP